MINSARKATTLTALSLIAFILLATLLSGFTTALAVTYYPKYTGSSASIVDALDAVGVDSSYANREKIAAANGITGYSGTPAQNTQMLNLLKAGTLIKPDTSTYFPKYTGTSVSIVDALNAVGADSSFANREKIATANGITGYSGTPEQNTQMLNLLKAGTLKKPGTTTATYTFTVDTSGTYTFTSAVSGYGAQTAKTVTVKNTGNQSGTFSISTSSTNFTLSKTTTGALAGESSTTFTVVPKTGLATGTFTSTITVNGGTSFGSKTFTVSFTVTAATVPTSVSLNVSTLSLMNAGKTSQLTATVAPSTATNKTVTWTSSNTAIATVSTGGLVTAKGGGKCTITVTTSNSKTATCTVYVLLVTNSSYNVSVTNRAKENSPQYVYSTAAVTDGKRSKEAYDTVIDQFKVASNSRYTPSGGDTWCNIFGWDVMSAMGVQLPHWIKSNVPATSTTSGATEINANSVYTWMKNYGSGYGWTSATARTAQDKANLGYPVVGLYYNSGGHGHVIVVRPETTAYPYSTAKGPVIAQAGASNFNYGYPTIAVSNFTFYYHQ